MEKRHRLALHIGAHQGTVGVVVLEEGHKGRSHGHQLLRRHIHIVDVFAAGAHVFAARSSSQHGVLEEHLRLGIEGGVRLRDGELLFFVGGEPLDVVGDFALFHPAIGSLDEAELVHGSVARKGADEADVRAFGRLDGAHAPVVGGVHVAHLDGGTLTGQASGTQS